MLSQKERALLEAVAHGRDSLDHFVDQFGMTCAEALHLAESLRRLGYLQQRGTLYLDSLSYDLTEQGQAVLNLSSAQRSLREARLNVADLQLLSRLQHGAVDRAQLEEGGSDSVCSQLAHLSDQGYVAVTGIFRGRVTLTPRGRDVLARYGNLLDAVPREGS